MMMMIARFTVVCLVSFFGLLSCDSSGGGSADTVGTDVQQCVADCSGKQCGDDGCGGSCGGCAGTAFCNAAGMCSGACIADCRNKDCGADGCGGTCGTCTGNTTCNTFGLCASGCVGDCSGKLCGDDGCGGTCGTCTGNTSCNTQGQCIPGGCTGDCTGKSCGDDGCGNSCGTCMGASTCNTSTGQCIACTPDCSGGKNCGDNGCGGSCGTCQPNQTCNAQQQCEAGQCIGDCTNKDCGDDGCGTSCGTCTAPQTCNTSGQCAGDCVSNCLNKVCGDNGCGGTCGPCGNGTACNAAQTACEATGCDTVTATGPLEVIFDGIYQTEGVAPELGGAMPDRLALEFYTDATGFQDLTSSANSNYASCEQCVRIFEDVDISGMSPPLKQYYQSSGSITITPATPPLQGTVEATLTGVTLVEVTVDGDFNSSVVPGGSCVTLNGPVTLATGVCTPACDNKVCGADGCGGICGGGCAAGQTCSADQTQCDALTCTAMSVNGALEFQQAGYFTTEAVTPALGGALPELLGLEFYADTTGTIDLASVTNSDYATCEQCILIAQDFDDTQTTAPTKFFMQTAGAMNIDAGTPPQSGEALSATVTGLILSEVAIDPDTFASTVVSGGECLSFASPLTLATPACVPDCNGGAKICGSNGCGGSCGTCTTGTCNLAGTACETTPPACQAMTVTGPLTAFAPNAYGTTAVTPALGGAEPEALQIEFYADATGSFDLASATNASYATCEQCVRVFTDVGVDGTPQLFQSAGTMTVDGSTPPQDGAVTLTLTDVTLVEVTITDDLTTTPVTNGACLTLSGSTTLSTP